MNTNKTSKARENILRKIRQGLEKQSLPMPFPEMEQEAIGQAFVSPHSTLEETFAENFIQLGGKFVFCDNEQELFDNIHALYDQRGWQQLLCSEPRLLHLFRNNKLDFIQQADVRHEGADACITGCELLLARTGSVLLSSKQLMGRTASIFYPVHLVVAYAGQLKEDILPALAWLKEQYGEHLPSMVNLNTGPSRTADIEKTLVVGVHGPREVFCFLVNA